MHLTILEQQAVQEEQMVKEAKETSELMKKVGMLTAAPSSMSGRISDDAIQSFATAEEEFKTAVDSVPSGWVSLSSSDDRDQVDVFTSWEIVGMHMVESLTNSVTAPVNALFGTAKVKSHYLQTGSSPPGGRHTQILKQMY